MTKDEALDKALYALEIEDSACRYMKDETPSQIVEAITAIKQALAATVQEPVAKTFGEENVELGVYSDNASNGQQRELVGEVEMGQLVGDGAHKSASNPDAKGEIAVIRGVDEYGPMLDWYEHWVNFPVGTKLYTTPPAQEFVCSTGLCHYKAKSDERLMETLKQEPDAYGYAKRLAEATWKKHYQFTAPQWEPFDDLMGVLTQIDNMTAGLTAPPAAQRQWVGLTDDEVIKCTPTWGGTVEDVARAIEAKLKEKNT